VNDVTEILNAAPAAMTHFFRSRAMKRCFAPSLLLLAVLSFSAANADEDPAFAAWYYPGATQNSAATLGGKLHQTLLITKDDVKKVENFYLKKSDDPLADELAKDTEPPPFGIHSSQGYPHPKDPKKYISTIWGDDSWTKTDGEQRGVTIRTLVYDTDDLLVTVTLSRTKTDKETHIVLLCMKKK
jgi:hypothetical protein